MSNPIVFVTHNRVRPGKLDGLRAYLRTGVAKLDAQKPKTIAFLPYLNADASEITIVHVFPDADGFDRHLEGVQQRIKETDEFLESRGFEIYGKPSEGVLKMFQQLAASGATARIDTNALGGYWRLARPV